MKKAASHPSHPVDTLLVLPFWYRLTQVVREKRPLNGCSSSIDLTFRQPRYYSTLATFTTVDCYVHRVQKITLHSHTHASRRNGKQCRCNSKQNMLRHTHTHTQPFNGLLSGTTRVGRYQKKHSPTHTHPDHRTSFIIFLHLQRSMASSLFSLRA